MSGKTDMSVAKELINDNTIWHSVKLPCTSFIGGRLNARASLAKLLADKAGGKVPLQMSPTSTPVPFTVDSQFVNASHSGPKAATPPPGPTKDNSGGMLHRSARLWLLFLLLSMLWCC